MYTIHIYIYICMCLYSFPSIPKLRQQWIQALINLNGQENALNLPKTASLGVIMCNRTL